MKNTIKNIMNRVFVSALFVALAGTVACTGNYEELNTDQYSATPRNMEADFLSYGAMITQMQRDLIPTSDEDANDFQTGQNLVGDIFGGYLAAMGFWNNGSNGTTYNLYYANWYDTAFALAYENTMSPWIQLKEQAEREGEEVPLAIANILKVGAMHRITDMYGPIPYEDFGKADEDKAPEYRGFTKYDSQKDVYLKFFSELDSAIATLEAFSEPTIFARYDLYFGGDVTKWIKYANSLKLRLAIRLAYVPDGEFADKTPAEYAAEAIAGGVMDSNADNAFIKSLGSTTVFNPLYRINQKVPGEAVMSASMDSYLNGYEDPRVGMYFLPASNENNTNSEYWGARHGVQVTSDVIQKAFAEMSFPIFGTNDPVKVMSAAECYFLRAEAALRGWTAENVQAMYETGIETSFEEWGLSKGAAATYYADSGKTPANFAARGATTTGGITARGTITIAWNDSDSDELKLERIITQKWIAGFPEGQEAWSEFRRTGYPKLFPVASNNSNGDINTATQIRRVIFSRSDMAQNEQGYNIGVTLLGGADNGGTKLWWDKK